MRSEKGFAEENFRSVTLNGEGFVKRGKKIAVVAVAFILIAGYIRIRPVWIPADADIPAALAENYLGKQVSLSDYRVRSAEFNPTDNQAGKYIRVTYDVKPKESSYFSWNAGNGREGEDGWLVDKFAFMEYMNVGDLYITVGSFTGF